MNLPKLWPTTDALLRFAKLIVEWHLRGDVLAMNLPMLFPVRPIQEYAKSCLQVAEYQMRIPDGDLYLAKDYLERVANSNAEGVMKATELLKVVKTTLQTRVQTSGAESESQAIASTLQPREEGQEGHEANPL